MIPLGDATRKTRRFPIATVLVILANAVVFFMELQNGEAFYPALGAGPGARGSREGPVTVLTAMFMHAGWVHILGNMLFFWVFAPPIEEVMRPLRFLVFLPAGRVAATFAQVAVAPASTVPNLGASGAIAGVMGAFLVTYPREPHPYPADPGNLYRYRVHPGHPAGGHLVRDPVV